MLFLGYTLSYYRIPIALLNLLSLSASCSMSCSTFLLVMRAYARITNKKIEHDMEQFADKLGKFNTAMGIGENSWQ